MVLHGKNFMAVFTILDVVLRISLGILWISAILVYVINIRVGIWDLLTVAIIRTLDFYTVWLFVLYTIENYTNCMAKTAIQI